MLANNRARPLADCCDGRHTPSRVTINIMEIVWSRRGTTGRPREKTGTRPYTAQAKATRQNVLNSPSRPCPRSLRGRAFPSREVIPRRPPRICACVIRFWACVSAIDVRQSSDTLASQARSAASSWDCACSNWVFACSTNGWDISYSIGLCLRREPATRPLADSRQRGRHGAGRNGQRRPRSLRRLAGVGRGLIGRGASSGLSSGWPPSGRPDVSPVHSHQADDLIA